MDPDYWLGRWARGEIGWHRDAPLPWLLKHWPSLQLRQAAKVLVPLCGKSVDMAWLADQGHAVLGVELSAQAINEFFAEHARQPEEVHSEYGVLQRTGRIELLCADIFALPMGTLAGCAAVYDRAAFFAMPPDLRPRYADAVYGALPRGCSGLLVTLEYPQHEKAGPPFSLPEAEVRALLEPQWSVEVLERRDVLDEQPAFRAEGVTRLDTVIYRLVNQ